MDDVVVPVSAGAEIAFMGMLAVMVTIIVTIAVAVVVAIAIAVAIKIETTL